MILDFDWVDAFADAPFGGNGCAVVHGGAALPEAVCTAYVRETSLVECTFTGPSEKADLRVRYFLADREIPFAGHPTIATVAALVHRGLVSGDTLSLEAGAGLVAVTVEGDVITMTQQVPSFGPRVPAELVAAVGGLDASDILGAPQVVSTGLPFCIAVVKDRTTLDALHLDPEALERFRGHLGDTTQTPMEPFWVTLGGATEGGDTYSRLLLAPPSPPEDPFTGSASGAMAAYLWAEGRLDGPKFIAEQGHGMGRPGRAQIEVLGPPDAITGVRVAGKGQIVMSGQVHLPEQGADR